MLLRFFLRPQAQPPGMPSRQRGLAAVEFAIVGLVFFTLLFAVLEGGRLLFMWNFLDEVTRRGARLAAVCPVSAAGVATIQQRALMNGSVTTEVPNAAVAVEYLNGNGTPVGASAGNVVLIRFVRVSIDPNAYQFQALFPFNVLLPSPPFTTTLPSESLGVAPPGAGNVNC